MTPEDVRARVDQIREFAGPGCDYEALHGDEDKLHLDVLKAIAERWGQPIFDRWGQSTFDPVGLAREAIKTEHIDFPRYGA